MKAFKKLVMLLVLAVPVAVSAEGLGVYVPFSLYSNSSVDTNDVKADYDPSLGLGLMYDTNVGENKLFNYRLGLEYMRVGVDNVQGVPSDQSNNRFDIVNTFGFGIVRSENMRLWIGPRINVAWNSGIGGVNNSGSALEIGVAPAVGVNVELSRDFVLGLDIDYRVAYLSGTWDGDSARSFYGDIEGATARVYMIYMFGETFPKPMPKDVVDSSL